MDEEKYGILTVIEKTRKPVGKDGWSKTFAICVCECGNKKTIALASLKNGLTKSCGCQQFTGKGTRTHGLRNHPLYKVWLGMRNRCNNKNSQDFQFYGERGIKVCERWDDFSLFLADMGERPTDEHEIERCENSGDYCPDNCRWATHLEQMQNTRKIRLIEFDGQSKSLKNWSVFFNVTPSTLHESIDRHGEAIAMLLAKSRMAKNQ